MYFTSFPFLTTTCSTKICNHFWFAKHFVKYFYFLFGLVVYLLSACGWEDYCIIRQLTSKPICFTKICNHFWFAKYFVKYFLFFSLPSLDVFHFRVWRCFVLEAGIEPALPLGNSILSAACLPIPPPEHFTIMSKNLSLLFHKDINLFWNHKTIKHKKTPLFWRGVLNVICI